MRTDEVVRVSPEEPRRTILPQFIRQVAAVGAIAFVLGRMVSPGLRGTREGLDVIIFWVDQLGAFASYLFAFGALSASNPTVPLPLEYPSDKALFTVTFYYNEEPPNF